MRLVIGIACLTSAVAGLWWLAGARTNRSANPLPLAGAQAPLPDCRVRALVENATSKACEGASVELPHARLIFLPRQLRHPKGRCYADITLPRGAHAYPDVSMQTCEEAGLVRR